VRKGATLGKSNGNLISKIDVGSYTYNAQATAKGGTEQTA